MFIVHGLLDISSAIVGLLVCFLTYKRWKSFPSTFNAVISFAFFFSFVQEAIHGFVSMVNDLEITAFWAPWTWALSRFTLASFLMIGVYYSRRKHRFIAIPLTLLPISSILAFFFLGHDFEFVYMDGLVKRPLDLFLSFYWLLALLFVGMIRQSSIHCPNNIMSFMFLGFLCHVVMAFFSAEYLDNSFILAHVLKLFEISIWAFAVLREDSHGGEIKGGILADKSKECPEDLSFHIEAMEAHLRKVNGKKEIKKLLEDLKTHRDELSSALGKFTVVCEKISEIE